VKTKPLPQAALDTISSNGVVVALLHNHAKTMVGEIIRSEIDNKVAGPCALAGPFHLQVLTR
jgi:hypothetical protein